MRAEWSLRGEQAHEAVTVEDQVSISARRRPPAQTACRRLAASKLEWAQVLSDRVGTSI